MRVNEAIEVAIEACEFVLGERRSPPANETVKEAIVVMYKALSRANKVAVDYMKKVKEN